MSFGFLLVLVFLSIFWEVIREKWVELVWLLSFLMDVRIELLYMNKRFGVYECFWVFFFFIYGCI